MIYIARVKQTFWQFENMLFFFIVSFYEKKKKFPHIPELGKKQNHAVDCDWECAIFQFDMKIFPFLS